MNMKKALGILGMLVLSAATLFAADVTGTWKAKVYLGDQTGSPIFVLKQDGEKLTGTYSGALGEAQVRGTVKGNEIVLDFDVSGAAIHYAGKIDVEGKKIDGSVDYGGQASGTFTATKSEPAKDNH